MIQQHFGDLLFARGIEETRADPVILDPAAFRQRHDFPAQHIGLTDPQRPLNHADFQIGKQANRRLLDAKCGIPVGVIAQHTDHLQRHDGLSPFPGRSVGIDIHRLGNDLQLVGQREGIEISHVLVRPHCDHFVRRAGHADMQIREDHEIACRAQLRHARLQQGLAMIRPDGGARLQHRRAILLEGPAHRPRLAGGRPVNFDPHLLALEHHVQEVAGETAPLEPGIAPDLCQVRHELREMRRALNRPRLDAQPFGFGIIMQALVSAIGLLLQHLGGRAQRPLERLGHCRSLPRQSRSLRSQRRYRAAVSDPA